MKITPRLLVMTALIAVRLPAADAPLGAIGVRSGGLGAEFYDRATGEKFTPRGVNWLLLAGSGPTLANVSFREPAFSQALPQTEAMFGRLRSLGYNLVRVRLDGHDAEGPNHKVRGLNPDYVADLVAFVKMAARYRLRVEIAASWTPGNYYSAVMAEDYPRPQPGAEGTNMVLMSPGLAAAQGYYLADILTAIRQASPDLLPAVFAVDVWDEMALDADHTPFSKGDGKFALRMVRKTYRLDDADARQSLADEATGHWLELALAPIRKAAPEVLTTLSTFSPHEAGRDGYTGVTATDSSSFDPRQPLRLSVLEQSPLDFLEIHLNPQDIDGSVDPDLEPMEWTALRHTKPIIVGEFGARRRDYGSLASAEAALVFFLQKLRAKQIAGWMYWTWNTSDGHGLYPFWNLADGDDYLAKAIAPSHNPW